eukprot:5618506-Prymnesium_polylepis.1
MVKPYQPDSPDSSLTEQPLLSYDSGPDSTRQRLTAPDSSDSPDSQGSSRETRPGHDLHVSQSQLPRWTNAQAPQRAPQGHATRDLERAHRPASAGPRPGRAATR